MGVNVRETELKNHRKNREFTNLDDLTSIQQSWKSKTCRKLFSFLQKNVLFNRRRLNQELPRGIET